MSRSDYLQEYVEEVREHLQELESSLLVLEREGSNREELGQIFRAAHSIKGASAYMGFEGLAHLTHELETLISQIQAQARPVTAKGVSLLLECVDFISRALVSLEATNEELPLPETLLHNLHGALSSKPPSVSPAGVEDNRQGPRPAEKQAPHVEKTKEDELLRIRTFLSLFRERYWDLVNEFVLSIEAMLTDGDVAHALQQISDLVDLCREEDFEELTPLLRELQSALSDSYESGQSRRVAYTGLFNLYSERLHEVLPSLEIPLLTLGAEDESDQELPEPNWEDEEDRELLSIFVESFQHHFSLLASPASASPDGFLSSSDLSQIKETIKRLTSSAHYMDYDAVVALLRGLETSLLGVPDSGPISIRAYKDLVESCAERLQEALPILHLSDSEPKPTHGGSTGEVIIPEEEDEELLGIFLDSFRQDLTTLADLVPSSATHILGDEEYGHALETVRKLASSAFYMDYDVLVAELRDLEASLRRSKEEGLLDGHQYTDILTGFGERARRFLPPLHVPVFSRHAPEAPEEAEDEELLGIFVDAIQQNFAQLLTLAPAKKEEALSPTQVENALDLVKRSISSAWYMDYGHVVTILKELDYELRDASNRGVLDAGRFMDHLTTCVRRMKKALPSLDLKTRPPEAFEEEVGEPEEDRELVEIFLSSLRQTLADLASLKPSPPDEALNAEATERFSELLKRGISSARYMDYQDIEDVFREWQESFDALAKEGPPGGDAYTQICQDYANRLERMAAEKDDQVLRRVSPLEIDLDREIELELFPEIPSVTIDETPSEPVIAGMTRPEPRESPPPEGILAHPLEKEEPEEEGEEEGRIEGAAAAVPVAREGTSIATLRVNVQKVDQLLNQVMELVVRRSEFADATTSFMGLLRELASMGKLSKSDIRRLRMIGLRLNESTLSLGRVANDLQSSVMRVRMLPISQLFKRFPRVVRDQALKLGKKAELVLEGSETEIDKRVLEQMYDPLVQFIRNAIVHGIEPPEERRAAGKPEHGTIRMSAFQEGDYVVLDIEDDGRGIDTAKLARILKRHRVMSAYDVNRMSNEELIQAIFLPGISTHGSVDGTAGRGVGLDVVRDNVERMNGMIEVESESGVGTRFTVRIPLTVAIIRALMVKGGAQLFALPLNAVSRILKYRMEEVHTIEGFQVIQQRGKTIPLVRLSRLLNLQEMTPHGGNGAGFIVVVATTFREVGLVVDGLRGEREIVIKPIEDDLHSFDGFSGATILGDGTVSLILDVTGLLKQVKDRMGTSRKKHGALSTMQ